MLVFVLLFAADLQQISDFLFDFKINITPVILNRKSHRIRKFVLLELLPFIFTETTRKNKNIAISAKTYGTFAPIFFISKQNRKFSPKIQINIFIFRKQFTCKFFLKILTHTYFMNLKLETFCKHLRALSNGCLHVDDRYSD